MSITLATVATQFLERPGLSQNTIRSYESALLSLLQDWGRVPVDSFTRQMLEKHLSSLTHLSHNTYNRHQGTIQSVFNFAIEQGYLSSNPASQLKRRKPDSKKGEHSSDDVIRYLNPQQVRILYSRLEPNSRLHTLVLLLHRTGARVAEALALDLEQVDLTNRKFRVVGKGNKQRWCFYGDDLAQVLDKYIKFYRHSNCAALFTAQQPFSLEVTRLSYPTAYKDWRQAITGSLELRGCRLHDLRHTFATERVGLMGIEELRALMGHSNIQTTLCYQKVTSSRAEEVAKKAIETLIKS